MVDDWFEDLAVQVRLWSYTLVLADQLYFSFDLLQHLAWRPTWPENQPAHLANARFPGCPVRPWPSLTHYSLLLRYVRRWHVRSCCSMCLRCLYFVRLSLTNSQTEGPNVVCVYDCAPIVQWQLWNVAITHTIMVAYCACHNIIFQEFHWETFEMHLAESTFMVKYIRYRLHNYTLC